MDELPRMVLRRTSLLALLALTFCGAVLGVLLIALTDPDRTWHAEWLLWALLVAAALGEMIAAWRLWARRFQIVLDAGGLCDRAQGDRVPWQAIQRIRMAPASPGQPPRVILHLGDETGAETTERAIPVAGVRPDPEWALNNTLLYWRRYKDDL
jgi:hypothetical protein